MHKEVTAGAYSEDSLRDCSLRIVKKYIGLTIKREKKYEDRLWFLQRKFCHPQYHKVALI
jgi:hypothetical protein